MCRACRSFPRGALPRSHSGGGERADDFVDSSFGVAEEHLGVVAEDEGVLYAGVADAMDRLKTMTLAASQTFRTGMPAIGLPGSSAAAR